MSRKEDAVSGIGYWRGNRVFGDQNCEPNLKVCCIAGASLWCDRCTTTRLTSWKDSVRKEAVGTAGGRWSTGEPLYLMLLPGGCLLRHRSYGRMER